MLSIMLFFHTCFFKQLDLSAKMCALLNREIILSSFSFSGTPNHREISDRGLSILCFTFCQREQYLGLN